jgi:hypothetical protein
MELDYLCSQHERRRLLSESTALNGIDYLEVVDHDAPAGTPRQRTLLVHLFNEIAVPGLRVANVRIDRHPGAAPVKPVWAYPHAELPATLLRPAEDELADQLDALTAEERKRLLLVRTDSEGDYTEYRLSIVRSRVDEAPPDKFDRLLSQIDFSFKVECESDFDCAPADRCVPERPAEPPIDYLAKDYASFRRLMLDRLAVVMPEWHERSPADLEVALVELLAYSADQLSYRQDAVATEAYLGTARLRPSIRRHGRLLDYRLHDGCNARTWVALEVTGSAKLERVSGAGRLRFLTRCDERAIDGQDTRWEVALRTERPTVFEPVAGRTLYEGNNLIHVYTWGDERCCLPKGATRATLLDEGTERVRLRAGDVIVLEEVLGPETGRARDADVRHRQAVRLTRVTPAATPSPNHPDELDPPAKLLDPLTGKAIVEIEWSARDALRFPLCVSAEVAGKPVVDVSLVRGNVVLADHGRTIEDGLDPLIAPEGAPFRPFLPGADLTSAVTYIPTVAHAWPAWLDLAQDPAEALPAVSLSGDGAEWTPQPDLLASDRFSTDFVVETEDDGSARLRFGDGEHGRAPTPGKKLMVRLRTGSGSAGNVSAGALVHAVVTTPDGKVAPWASAGSVRNPMAAVGGVDPEPVEDARLYAPEAFRVQQRAVSLEDYAEVARRHPEVQRAAARLRWTGSWYTVFVTVDRFGGRPIDDAFAAELRRFLERYRLAGIDLEVRPPRFVPLDIAFGVCVTPGYRRADVERALLEALSAGELPGGGRGFFHPDNFTFGNTVYLSQIVDLAMELPGVEWVDFDPGTKLDRPLDIRFRRLGRTAAGELEAGRIVLGDLEVARLDNDPSAPENGRVELYLDGGL